MALRSRAKAKGQTYVNLSAGGMTRNLECEAFDYPHDTPASRVGVSVAVRRSENYQSAEVMVAVEVPCTPGAEIAAGEFCADKCSILLKSMEGDLESLVQSLS